MASFFSGNPRIHIAIAVAALAILLPSMCAAAPKRKAFIVSHFHYDPVWTNSQAGETMRAFSIMHQDLEYARLETRFKFVLSEMDYMKPYWDAYPRNRAALTDLFKAGRVEFTGGYSEPDEAEVGGEALIRNFVYGKIYKEAHFGLKVRSGAQLDVFGHAVQLPQILKKSGYDFEMHSRGNLTDLPLEFDWLAPDGSSVTTKRIDYGGNANEVVLAAHEKQYYDLTNNAMIMSGGDFTPPDRSIGGLIKNTKTFQVVNDLPSAFFETLLKDVEAKKEVIPLISRDNTPLLPGCYTSRIDTKLANRLAENTLTGAEEFSAIAALQGAEYPWAALDKAWRILLFGQHHDGLTGSDSENVNLDMLAGWREAVDIAAGVKQNAIAFIAAQAGADAFAGKKSVKPLVIFNSLNWERTEPVEFQAEWPGGVSSFAVLGADKQQVAYQIVADKKNKAGKTVWAKFSFIAEKIPSVGYATYYLAEGLKPAVSPYIKKAAGNSVKSDFYTIRTDPARGGGIVSLVENATGKEYMNTAAGGVGNEFFAIKENAHKVEGPWSIHSTGQFWRSGKYPATVTVEDGPVFSRLIVEAEPVRRNVKIYNGNDVVERTEEEEVLPHRVQEIIVYKHYPRIDFRTNILGYKQTDFLFKVGFPADVKGALPVFEERFAAVGRDKNDQDFLFYDFWREPGVKKGREYPAMNWMDLTSPARIVFLDGDGNVKSTFALAIGELVSDFGSRAMTLSNNLAAALVRKGVTTTPTRHDKDRTNEYYGFRVSLGVKGANKYTELIKKELTDADRKKLDGAVAKNGYGFLFVSPPESITATPDKKKIPVLIVEAVDEDMLEGAVKQIAGDLEEHGNIIMPEDVNAAGITGTGDNAGMALINYGLPGNSVEYDGTMTLTLMRSSTAGPSGRQYSRNLEIENWNHAYNYALLPHGGDWMKAKVWRYGHEFNNPLAAVLEKEQHKGKLPPAMSFLSTPESDAVISMMKLKGFPYADGKSPDGVAKPQLALRLYNPTGFPTYGSVKFFTPIQNVSIADMLENKIQPLGSGGNSFQISNDSFSIDTYVFEPREFSAAAKPVKLAPDTDLISLYNTRYWETNQGAAAAGFQPLAMTLEPGAIDTGGKRMDVYVTLANGSMDRQIKGQVTFNAPGGKVEPIDYSLAPGALVTETRQVEGFDPKVLREHFVSAQTAVGGQRFEDVLTFNDWKVFAGDAPGAEKPDFDDSKWETMPLARFWSEGTQKAGALWYRRWVFIPEGMGDIPMHFERGQKAAITVYVNGQDVRVDKEARGFSPLINAVIKFGAKNLFAIKVEDPEGTARMWGTALAGSETLFSQPIFKFASDKLALAPGGKTAIKVTITNPFKQKLEGAAQVVSPIETWPSGGPFRMLNIGPAVKNFSLAPGASGVVEFEVSAQPDALPGPHLCMVKIIYAGTTSYTGIVDIEVKK